MASSKNGLGELAGMISAAIEKARQLNMHGNLYSISGAGGSIGGRQSIGREAQRR